MIGTIEYAENMKKQFGSFDFTKHLKYLAVRRLAPQVLHWLYTNEFEARGTGRTTVLLDALMGVADQQPGLWVGMVGHDVAQKHNGGSTKDPGVLLRDWLGYVEEGGYEIDRKNLRFRCPS